MATSVRQFNVELYQEHLEEASFLYEQRLTYLNDPEVDWPDIGMWEDRFEAHIAALVVGGAPAVDVCCDRACGDAGAAHAALRVLCRQDEKDAAFAILRAVDAEDDAIRRAVAEALCREAPARWLSGLLAALEQDSQLTGIVAHVFGYRRGARAEGAPGGGAVDAGAGGGAPPPRPAPGRDAGAVAGLRCAAGRRA